MKNVNSVLKKQKLTNAKRKISELKPADYNPRHWTDKIIQSRVDSLNEFGQVGHIVINTAPGRENVIIGGNLTYVAMKKLGFSEANVILVNIPNLEDEKRLNLRLNRTGEWDLEKLRDFEINVLLDVGFDDSELSTIWDDVLVVDEDGFDEEQALKQALVTDIKLGDMFALGNHRLICADSGDPQAIKRLVGDQKPGILYSDPIFNIGLDYDKGVSLQANYGGRTKDRKPDKEYGAFLGKILGNALAVMAEDAHVFMYCDQRYIWLLQTLMAEHGLTNKRICLWIKNNFNMTPQVAFNKAFEPCVYAVRGKPYLSDTHNLTEILNKDIAVGNRAIDDIIDIFDIWLAKRDPSQDYQHPTQKPVTLHQKPLKRCTKPGDVVLDVFAGSGSLLSACEQLKRTALLSEIDPVFCQVIVDRYEALSGLKAVKL